MLTRTVDVELGRVALWMLVGIAFAVLFIVKYRGTATGILGLVGSLGHALVTMGLTIVQVLTGPVFRPDQAGMVQVLLDGLNLAAIGTVFVAIMLAPGLGRQVSAFHAQPATPPPPQG